MMATTTKHNATSARMLGQRLRHIDVLLVPKEPLSDRKSDVVAGVCVPSASSWPWSLLSSCASSGVCSVLRIDRWERADRDERADFCEVGRELGVRVEPQVPSGVSMAADGKEMQAQRESRVSCVGSGGEDEAMEERVGRGESV